MQIVEKNDIDRLPFKLPKHRSDLSKLEGVLSEIRECKKLNAFSELDHAVFEYYGIEKWQREYITDTIDYDFDFFRHGLASFSVQPPNKIDLSTYAVTLVKQLRSSFSETGLTINADLIMGLSDLSCVLIRFNEDRNRQIRCVHTSDDEVSSKLSNLLHAPLTSTVKLRRSLVHFDNDQVVIVKLPQKRFWSRARAYDDADTILEELCRGGE
jgi:hypothetical protein